MLKQFVSTILLSLMIVGCSERYGGPIYPVPHIPDERPAVPSDSQVMTDLQDVLGQIAGVEIESEIISVDSRVYIVIVDRDSESTGLLQSHLLPYSTANGSASQSKSRCNVTL